MIICIRDLTPEEAWNKRDLFDKLSIENWILPGCFVGVFSTIVWVCPPWSSCSESEIVERITGVSIIEFPFPEITLY